MPRFIRVPLDPKENYPKEEATLNIDSISYIEETGAIEESRIVMKTTDEFGDYKKFWVYEAYDELSRRVEKKSEKERDT